MSTSSPTSVQTIDCFVTKKPREPLHPFQYKTPPLGPFDILIEISHCGICHSDLHLINNDWGNSIYPLVPGHEIIGTIVQKGTNVEEFSLGQRVGVGWQRSSCGHCEWCRQGEENLCFSNEATCNGHHGGFASAIVADSRFAFAIPEALSSENAAPLLCGGATVFSPLLHYQVSPTWRIGVIGIGGLGHLAIQFANAFGCEVYAFSSSPSKEAEAKALGAHHFVSSVDPKEIISTISSIDMLICASSEHMQWEVFLSTLRPKGKLCLVGVPKGGHVDIKIPNLIVGKKTVCGSAIGSTPDIRKMFKFAALHNIVAKTEVFPMKNVNTALEKLSSNQIHYRAVLEN